MTLAPALPEVLPVFPLPGALLLPRAILPLHIFEPRYRALVRDALEGAGIFGMIQPRAEGPDPDNPPIYAVGCAGEIRESRKLPDGRYLISLQGVARFRVDRELERHPDGYRTVHADFSGFDHDLDAGQGARVEREGLMEALRDYLPASPLQDYWDSVGRTDDETLVNALAMAAPFPPNEKQALLECRDLGERAEMLRLLFSMSAMSAANDDAPPGVH